MNTPSGVLLLNCSKCGNAYKVSMGEAGIPYVCDLCNVGIAKPSNPKDIIGSMKLPLNLVPAVTIAYAALGHAEGMLKYGLVNWRECGVRVSVYLDALERHIKKFTEGEWYSEHKNEDGEVVARVPHLANALACISIIIDAYHAGKLVDDRPKSNPGAVQFIEQEGVEILKGLIVAFGKVQPKHYTIEQGQPQNGEGRG